jgi:hypothetical protein
MSLQIPHKEVKKSLEHLIAGDWGLGVCDTRKKCKFCQAYPEEIDEDARRQYRNLYVAGFPPDLLSGLLDSDVELSRDAIKAHAFTQNWHRRKKDAPAFEFDKKFISELVVRRLMKSWNVISDSTGDKMIEAAMRISGVGQKVEVTSNVNISWEKIATKAQTHDGEATIILEDGEFSEVDLPQIAEQFEEESAQTD